MGLPLNRQYLYRETANSNSQKYSRNAIAKKVKSKVKEVEKEPPDRIPKDKKKADGSPIEKEVEYTSVQNPALTRHTRVRNPNIFPSIKTYPNRVDYYNPRVGAGNSGLVIQNMGEILRKVRRMKLTFNLEKQGSVPFKTVRKSNGESGFIRYNEEMIQDVIESNVPTKGYWGERKTVDINGQPTDWAKKSMYSQYYNDVSEERTTYWWVMAEMGKKISDRLAYTMDLDRYETISHFDPYSTNLKWTSGRSIIKNMHFDNYLTDADDEEVGGNVKKFNPFKNLFFNMGLGLGESPIINPPFQWNERDDPRVHSRMTQIGSQYYKHIYTNYPILMIMPGDIKYNINVFKMLGIDGGSAARTANYIRSGGDNGLLTAVKGLFQGIGDFLSVSMMAVSEMFGGSRLIQFRQRYNLYASYLSGLMKDLAVGLGLVNHKGQYIGKWANLHPTMILPGRLLGRTSQGGLFGFSATRNALLRSNQMLSFVVGKDVQCSETFQNSTKPNPVMEELNAKSQEQADDDKGGNTKLASSTLNGVLGILNKNPMAATDAVLNWGTRLAGNISETALIASGQSRMTLPDVWESSSFSRSYSVSLKFHSPYGDKMSIYENVYIPFLSLLALVLPRQVGNMSYTEPFAIKAVLPGQFNVNYGILESLSAKRGEGDDDWTIDNLPKTLTVDLTIKDFEPQMLMPLGSRTIARSLQEFIFPASGIAEYITTLSGMTLSEQLDTGKRGRRVLLRWKSGWQDVLNKDIMESYIYQSNPISNVVGRFKMFSQDTIKESEIQNDKYDLWIASASKLTQSKSSDSLLSLVPYYGNQLVNYALDKILPDKSNLKEDAETTNYKHKVLKEGEYYDPEKE